MLSKKHYIEIAKLLRNAKQCTRPYHHITASEIVGDLVDDFTEYFAADNPNFNVDKFNKAVYGDRI